MSLLLLISCTANTGPNFGTNGVDDSAVGTEDSSIPVDTEDSGEETGSDRVEIGPDAFEGRNVIVISIDTLGAKWIDTGHTDNLDVILADSVWLQNEQCSGAWTPVCMASVVAGSQSTDLGLDIYGFGPSGGFNPVPDSRTLLPEVLQANGYKAYLLTENTLYGGGTNTDQGFDDVVDSDITSGKGTLTADVVTFAEKVSALTASSQPFLAWFHVMAPHTPYIDVDQDASLYEACTNGKPALPSGVSLNDDRMSEVIEAGWDTYTKTDQENILDQVTCAYGAQVEWTDEMVFQNLWTQLDESGGFENAVVELMSDHGEELNDHDGSWGHDKNDYGVLNHTLGAIWAPDIAPQAITVPTNHGDIAPTLLEALGLDVPSDMTGSPIWDISNDRVQTFYTCDMEGKAHYAALNVEGTKQHRTPEGNTETYNVFADPEETGTATASTDPELQSAIDALRTTAQADKWCGGN